MLEVRRRLEVRNVRIVDGKRRRGLVEPGEMSSQGVSKVAACSDGPTCVIESHIPFLFSMVGLVLVCCFIAILTVFNR